MSSYEVLYFNYAGRAYLTRVMLTLAGVPYKDVFPDWPSEKPNMPFGRLPVLRETSADGSTFEICESGPIERYVAHKYGFLPQDLRQTAVLEQYEAQMEDSFIKFVTYAVYARTEENKKALIETTQYLLEKHEAVLSGSKSGFYYSDKISLPDLTMYFLYKGVVEIEDLDVDIFSKSKFPNVLRLVDLVGKYPGVQGVDSVFKKQ